MKHPNGKYDLTVDDIHNIRVETSKELENMTDEEIINFFNEASCKFDEKANNYLTAV